MNTPSYLAGWQAFRNHGIYAPESHIQWEYDKGWRDARYCVKC